MRLGQTWKRGIGSGSGLALLLLAACGGADSEQKGGGARPAPVVKAEPAAPFRFVAAVQAVGNAVANEQVTLSAPVTERLLRLGFDDGDFVRRGQMIAVLAQGQENAQLSEAQARARATAQSLERIATLREKGFATKAALDEQVAAAAAARAQVAEVRANLAERVITAPFSGHASLRQISPGAIVSSGTEIATISDISVVKLDFPVPETLMASLKPGLEIEAISSAYPQTPFRGRIATVDPVVNSATRSVLVRARLPNPDGRLKPGMLLQVAIETAPRTGLSVPELAVVGEGEDRFVFVVGADNVARRRAVRTGLRAAGRVEVLDGLRPGERVVTEGVVKLSSDTKVRLVGDAAGGAGRDAR